MTVMVPLKSLSCSTFTLPLIVPLLVRLVRVRVLLPLA
ncbi:hypothetical protein C1336_000090001 [Campylobacter jejuni subsp. jejuni 1336]|nr:hypothetical protein C1336_000090001 [Campylobacter jejuni subsp. jejuni 1336]